MFFIADAGEAIVVDPAIAIDQYLELACRHHFGIAHVVETHSHAESVSGTRALVELTAATAHRPLRPGDSVAVGSVVLRAYPGRAWCLTASVVGWNAIDPCKIVLIGQRADRAPANTCHSPDANALPE